MGTLIPIIYFDKIRTLIYNVYKIIYVVEMHFSLISVNALEIMIFVSDLLFEKE